MKLLIALLLLPLISFAQRNQNAHHDLRKGYSTLRAGASLAGINSNDAKVIGTISGGAGFRIKQNFLLGAGIGYFKLPDFDRGFIPAGVEFGFVNTKTKISPIANFGVYYPFIGRYSNEPFPGSTGRIETKGKFQGSVGGGIAIGKSYSKLTVMVHYSVLKYQSRFADVGFSDPYKYTTDLLNLSLGVIL